MTKLLILILLLGLLLTLYWYHDKILTFESTEPKVIAPDLESIKNIHSKNRSRRKTKQDLSFIDPESESNTSADSTNSDTLSNITNNSEDSNKSNNSNSSNSCELTFGSCDSNKTVASDFSLSDLK